MTGTDHQKTAALHQVARLVRQGQSMAGDQKMLQRVINKTLPLIKRWERSDPEFGKLAILLRTARIDMSPHVQMNIAAQVNSMLDSVGSSLSVRKNNRGEAVMWDPDRGNVTSPRFEPGDKITLLSPYDSWRGSNKYPFGKAFPEWNRLDGIDIAKCLPGLWLLGLGFALFFLIRSVH